MHRQRTTTKDLQKTYLHVVSTHISSDPHGRH